VAHDCEGKVSLETCTGNCITGYTGNPTVIQCEASGNFQGNDPKLGSGFGPIPEKKKKHVNVEHSTGKEPLTETWGIQPFHETKTTTRTTSFFFFLFLMVSVNGGMNVVGCCKAHILSECFMGLVSVGCYAKVES